MNKPLKLKEYMLANLVLLSPFEILVFTRFYHIKYLLAYLLTYLLACLLAYFGGVKIIRHNYYTLAHLY